MVSDVRKFRGVCVWLALVSAMIVVAAGVVLYQQWFPGSGDTSGYRRETMAVAKGSIVQWVDASGQVEAARQVMLSFASGGQVEALHVRRGDAVTEGQILAELENTQQRLALMRAETALETARIEGIRSVIREREYDLQLAQLNLERTRVRAPFSGIAADLRVDEGEMVSVGAAFMQLMDDSMFFARVLVDELDVAKIAPGQRVSVRVNAVQPPHLPGTVVELDRVAHTAGSVVAVPVLIALEVETPAALRPGYSASARIEVDRMEDVYVVPLEAVVRTGDTALASVVRDGEERIVELSLGISDGRNVAVLEGLVDGDEITPFNYQLFQAVVGSGRTGWDPGLPVGFPGTGR